mmetsp:Transcript_4082/g.11608  ORF Transcript_4082/g.11608 Transcript_4082/m.11608 type:complete len:256 (-) Transcript_4082:547-1314(-)
MESPVVSGRGREAHAVVLHVKDSVVLPQEDVTQDPERAAGRGHINANEAEEASLLTKGARLDHVLGALEGENIARESDRELGERVHEGAVDHVLACAKHRGRASLSGNGCHLLRRAREHRGARVEDALARRGGAHAAEGEVVERGLPVGVRGDGHVSELALEVVLVHAPEGEFPGCVVPQVEGEDRLVHAALLHQGLEDGGDTVHGDGGECHAQDAVEPPDAVGEAEARDCVHLSKLLVRGFQPSHAHRLVGEVA